MNKILLLVLPILAIVLGACSDDDNKDEGIRGANGERLISKIIEHDNKYGDDVCTFYYDKQGRIEKILNTGTAIKEDVDYTYTITYNHTDNKLISTCKYDDGIDIFTCTLNTKGYMVNAVNKEEYLKESNQQQENITYTYDDNDQLIKVTRNGYVAAEYTWSNGNLVKDDRGSYDVTTCTYTEKENKSNFDFGAAFFVCESTDLSEMLGYRGKRSKNFIKHDGKWSYNYTFDDEGYVTKIERYHDNDNTHISTYTIEYK